MPMLIQDRYFIESFAQPILLFVVDVVGTVVAGFHVGVTVGAIVVVGMVIVELVDEGWH